MEPNFSSHSSFILGNRSDWEGIPHGRLESAAERKFSIDQAVIAGIERGFLPDLNAVISGFRSKSRRLVGVSPVHPTRSECIHFGFASAVFECNHGSVAVLSEIHMIVIRRLDACSKCCAINFAGPERRACTER